MNQKEVDERVFAIEQKRLRGETLTYREHEIIQMAYGAACASCGLTHRKPGLNVQESR